MSNTLFYNNYTRKLIICDRLHWCWRKTQNTSQTFRLKYFEIVVETFLSHIMVFFVYNQCRILYFTIIIPGNSLYVTGCIGVEEKQKIRPKHLAWNISKSWWRPFLSHALVLFVLNQYRILYFTIIIRRNSVHVTGCIGVEEKPKIRPKHLAWNISKSWWRPFLSHVLVFFVVNQYRILYFTITIPEKWIYLGHTIRTHASPSPPYHRWSNGQNPGLTCRRTE